MRFNEELEKALKEQGINQSQLAQLLGCSKSSVSQWVSGMVTPTARKRERIATALGIAPDAFISEKDKRPPKIERMSCTEAARLLSVSPRTLQMGLQQGVFPWGYGIHMPSGKWTYVINGERFRALEGL